MPSTSTHILHPQSRLLHIGSTFGRMLAGAGMSLVCLVSTPFMMLFYFTRPFLRHAGDAFQVMFQAATPLRGRVGALATVIWQLGRSLLFALLGLMMGLLAAVPLSLLAAWRCVRAWRSLHQPV